MSTTDTTPVSHENGFRGISKLKTPAEFRATYKRGAKRTSRSFVVFVLPNGLEYSRFGLTTPRKLGLAHERNRIRRRIREALRTSWSEVPRGVDIVINPRSSALTETFKELKAELLLLLGTNL